MAPLPFATLERDACGRFRIQDLTAPALGTLALVVEDSSAASEDDLYLPTVTLLAVAASQGVESVEALATGHHADAVWTASAGHPFGAATYGDVGVVLFLFQAGGMPVSGVTVLRSGSLVPANDHYFADASFLQRQQIDPSLSATGANGSALFSEASFTTYTGFGGEPGGYAWESEVASALPAAWCSSQSTARSLGGTCTKNGVKNGGRFTLLRSFWPADAPDALLQSAGPLPQRLSHQMEVACAIDVIKKARQVVVSALDDVLWNSGQVEARLAGHRFSVGRETFSRYGGIRRKRFPITVVGSEPDPDFAPAHRRHARDFTRNAQLLTGGGR